MRVGFLAIMKTRMNGHQHFFLPHPSDRERGFIVL